MIFKEFWRRLLFEDFKPILKENVKKNLSWDSWISFFKPYDKELGFSLMIYNFMMKIKLERIKFLQKDIPQITKLNGLKESLL